MRRFCFRLKTAAIFLTIGSVFFYTSSFLLKSVVYPQITLDFASMNWLRSVHFGIELGQVFHKKIDHVYYHRAEHVKSTRSALVILDEHQKLRKLHTLIKRQFLLVLDTHSVSKSTQIAFHPERKIKLKQAYPGRTEKNAKNTHLKGPPEETRMRVNIQPDQNEKTAEYSLGRAVLASGAGKGKVVEAFDLSRAVVPQTSSKVLSYEGPRTGQQGKWVKVGAHQYWPTIYWEEPTNTMDPAELVSNNTAIILSKYAGTVLQNDMGIVFGRLPPRFKVSISGRAESPTYIPSGSSEYSNPYFALINVAPGSQVVSLLSGDSRILGSVVAPVVPGHSTYLDLTSWQSHSFIGKVLDGSNDASRGLGHVSVSVIGQDSANVETDHEGNFHLNNVISLGHYPMYVDANKATGFTHRYRLSVANGTDINLSYLKNGQVQRMVNSFQGGLSSESGMVIGMLPSLASQYDSSILFPHLQSLLPSPTLVPETYSLSEGGEVLVNKPLVQETARFISVEVPEGPVVAKVFDNNNQIVWSEFLPSSPNVINIVGSDESSI